MWREPASWHRIWILASCAGILAAIFPNHASRAAQADHITPQEFSSPTPLELSPRADKTAEAHARYLQAIFEEENEGPDKALESKRRVLFLEPGFHQLAVDVAQHYLRRNETPEAISVLKDAIKSAPDQATPALALASIYLRHLQKPVFAEKYALQALESAPDSITPYELLCEVYRANGQTRKIDPLLDKAAKRNTPDHDFWLGLADIRLRDITRSHRRPSENAIQKITALVDRGAEVASDNPEALTRAADYHLACGYADRATALYRRALALNPNLEGIREKLANCLIHTGDNTEAAQLLDEIIAVNPLNLIAYDQLARIHLQADDLPRALDNMRQALLLAPIDPRRYEDLIRVSLRAGDPHIALRFADEAEKKFPYLTGFTLFRAIALSHSGQHAQALMAFERTLVEASNTNPELIDSGFYMSYGAAAEQAGHFVKAAELLKKSIALDPENSADACNYLGYMWADRGENLPEAEQFILRALELNPHNGAYIDSLGWVYYHQGRYTEALAELLRAAELLTTPDPVVYEHIGDACSKLGQTAEAIAYWQKASQLAPENTLLTEKIDRHAARLARQPSQATRPSNPP